MLEHTMRLQTRKTIYLILSLFYIHILRFYMHISRLISPRTGRIFAEVIVYIFAYDLPNRGFARQPYCMAER